MSDATRHASYNRSKAWAHAENVATVAATAVAMLTLDWMGAGGGAVWSFLLLGNVTTWDQMRKLGGADE